MRFPRVAKIEETPGKQRNACFRQGSTNRLLVIHHETKMPSVIRGLPPAFLKREELVSEADEGHVLASPAQLELEKTSIEGKGFVDVTDFEGDVVETDRPGLPRLRHDA